MSSKIAPHEYIVYINLNKPVYFWGLTGIQIVISAFTIIIISLLGFFVGGLIIGSIILGAIVIPAYFIIITLQDKNKVGYPNYIQSYQIKQKTPYTVKDTGVLKKIYGNKI